MGEPIFEPPVDDLRAAANLLEEEGSFEYVVGFLRREADRRAPIEQREVEAVLDPEPFYVSYDDEQDEGEEWRVRRQGLGQDFDIEVGFATESEALKDAHRRTDVLRGKREYADEQRRWTHDPDEDA